MALPYPSRSGTILCGSACACRRTRRRRRSSASSENSAGGVRIFCQNQEVFFRPSLTNDVFDSFQGGAVKLNGGVKPFKTQLLKWIGNKQKQAQDIISYFPRDYGTYYEPFVGSGGVLGTLAPHKAVASDIFPPLVEIWTALCNEPAELKRWYAERYARMMAIGKVTAYQELLTSGGCRS
ncbi:DNA adenine methylase [Pseudomonas anguilliseptica]|uniref:DNA adenine methylase n=1 Tax=Pseudomonas anguilliseptica TaxID=53406 RepID=UPI00325B91D1